MQKKHKKIIRKTKRLSYPLGYWFFRFLAAVLRMLSRRQIIGLSKISGNFAFEILRVRRKLVFRNLVETFPDKTEEEIRAIARRVYQNQVLNLFELLRIPLVHSREDAQKIVKISACNSFTKAMNNTGAVVVSGHFGSWEINAFCSGLLLKPMNYIVKSIKNKKLDDYFIYLRTYHGNRIIKTDKALRESLRLLQKKEVVALLADQSQRKVDTYIDFLGRKTSVFLGPGFMALKAGVPLFVEFSRRVEDGSYHMEIVEVETSDLKYCKEDIVELVKRYHLVLENFIMTYPEEWLWLHDRWKRSPGRSN